MKKLLHDPQNIIVCGIGGQGNILASELLGSALVENGFVVAMGETYGASQRGGSVMSHIRVSASGELSVLIPKGEAHVIVGFEPLETLRMARQYGSRETFSIYDDRVSYPVGVLAGEQAYPPLDEINAELAARCKKALVVRAAELALKAGDGKAANIALMGALIALDELPLEKSDFERAIAQRFRGAALALNQQVFEMGYAALLAQLEGGAAK
jgi:indolepyruvate ferredoxin oxidoreductase beta subunit